MNCSSPSCDGPDSGFFSAANLLPEKKDDGQTSTSENEKLRSQLECLKNSLSMRMKDLQVQQELTRDLEDELERTKDDLSSLQDKFEKQERRNKMSTITSLSEPGLNSKYGTLFYAVNKVEATLRNLSAKHSCGLKECRSVIEKEIEKIMSVKNDLKCFEANKSTGPGKPCPCSSANTCNSGKTIELDNFQSLSYRSDLQSNRCNLPHVNDVESFREKALMGVATLEEMKEQLEKIENLIRKYIDEFPCDCDKGTLSACEEKLDTLRKEFDDITDQLCGMIQKLDEYNAEESCNGSSTTCYDIMKAKEQMSILTDDCGIAGDISRLRCDSQRLQKEICHQENEIEKLQETLRQLDCECEKRRNELQQQNKDLDTRMTEICRLKSLMCEIGQQLQKDLAGSTGSAVVRVPSQCTSAGNSLRSLFCAIKEFSCILEKANAILSDGPKLMEDNDKLKKKIVSMEKYICNKEETLRALQDTIKFKECQIDEFKSKVELSENETSKLAQDVEEKCRLIANLQDAVRKCKQFEVNVRSVQMEAMEFKICELDNKLKQSEKELQAKEKKLESLHNTILVLSSKNVYLIQKLNKMVDTLQCELKERENEVENLCGKIRDLEEELDCEFKKCENRALEDSKCIEDLSSAVKNFQKELCCARENYNTTLNETENLLMRERQTYKEKEKELKDKICQLKSEIKELRTELEENESNDNCSAKICDLENQVKEAESRQQFYEQRITELENDLQYTVLEHEEERKNMFQKLCEEKKENVKNKTLITKLNESIKQNMASEKALRERIDRFTEDTEILKSENQELRTEVEVRKKMICALENNESTNLTDLEELICHLQVQKADAKSRCCSLKAELDKELKLKRILECRVEDLSSMLENKLQEFDEMVKNYKCTTAKLQEALKKVKEPDTDCRDNGLQQEMNDGQYNEHECFQKIIKAKATENAKLCSRLLVMKVEMESLRTEYLAMQANKDSLISNLRHDVNCLDKNLQELEEKYQSLEEENRRVQGELDNSLDKSATVQAEFREKQKELCAKLRSTLCEKNDLLNSVDKLQQQLEHLCLENVNKDETNRELAEECSRLKLNHEATDNYIRNRSEKIICNLNKQVKNLECELCSVKENYDALNEEYQSLLEQFKTIEKKKTNLEKLYIQVNNENGDLQDLKMRMEKELCELKNQNSLLKNKIMTATKGENGGNCDEIKNLRNKVRELAIKVRTFEKKIIPELEQEIGEKNCCIENMNAEIREANISSQRMRNEALRVIQHTRKYLAAQRCANDGLKSRLESSNKRGNILGAENRELEEQLKAVTRMNEFLLCQLENSKSDVETEPRPCTQLPWGCATVERDTSSSEYLAESGIQSMQQSPTNMEYNAYDFKENAKRTSSQWNALKRGKHGGSAEYPSCRGNVR